MYHLCIIKNVALEINHIMEKPFIKEGNLGRIKLVNVRPQKGNKISTNKVLGKLQKYPTVRNIT